MLESFNIEGEIVKPPQDQSYYIQFKEDSTFSGKSDCNEIFGNYIFDLDSSLIIMQIVTTKIFCGTQSVGEKYFDAIHIARAYKIEDNKLSIYYGINSKLNFIGE